MSFPPNLHWIATIAAARIFFSMGIGTLLAVIVWLLLRVFPRRDSRTSFAVWFATLVITAALPLLSLYSGAAARAAGASPSLITISAAWAEGIFFIWAGIALAGLARVALALWQVQRLRSGAKEIDPEDLAPELRALIEECGQSRRVTLLVSQRSEVPTAIGFFRPAVVLPEWLLRETPAEELKYVILHELAHLRRRDDWTNLAQQIVKAVLFFVPSVWWIERKLALEREMACDDAVLEHSGTPRGYAECLARVAERSFLRRQLALAQAAVSRMRQLTARVTKILDPDRQPSKRVWKPAIPVVVAVAGLCAFSASQGPSLIGFADESRASTTLSEPLAAGPVNGLPAKAVADDSAAEIVPASIRGAADQPPARAWNAELKSSESPRKVFAKKNVARPRSSVPNATAKIVTDKTKSDPQPMLLGELRRLQFTGAESPRLAEAPPPAQRQAIEYVTVREEFVMVVTQRTGPATQESWQMHVVQISVVPAKDAQKQVPRKI